MCVNIGGDKERLEFMTSIGARAGAKRTVHRDTIYNDVIKLYECGEIVTECPLSIVYESEVAIDERGVTRDMYSAFWEEAYSHLFDGATILTPLVHAQTDMGMFNMLGKIISHGYPVHISLH